MALAVSGAVIRVVEAVVDFVGDVEVVEWGGVGVVAQCGGGVAMSEAGLGFEYFAFGDELGGDAVAKAVQRRVW